MPSSRFVWSSWRNRSVKLIFNFFSFFRVCGEKLCVDFFVGMNEKEIKERYDFDSPPKQCRRLSKEDTKPEDVRELTIKNLDTGEEFVIGENDPDFEFDTFPLSPDGFESSS